MRKTTILGIVAMWAMLSLVSGCTFMRVGVWSPYSVNVVIKTEDGSALANATVSSTTGQVHITPANGKTELYYSNRGLHVITVSAEGMETVQEKITMPNDNGKEIEIVIRRLPTVAK